MQYHVSSGAIKLFDSYLVPKERFETELSAVRYMIPDCPIWHLRSMGSMRREWATHNLLHSLGYKRNRTKDVDLNFSHKWCMNLVYWVVGSIALLFIE